MSSFSIGIGKKATIIFAETGSAEKRRFVLIGSLWRALATSPFAARHSLFAIRYSPFAAWCAMSRGAREMHARAARSAQCNTARRDAAQAARCGNRLTARL
ncbi:hypothetical protein J2A69_04305 [Burkholderia pseudomallei]|nr:hypothetical protein [Burkholderia pseudomallei]QSY10346.1 hypothetical protein J1906_04305 [Burkholderia pseudomallei]QSY18125.1 hypothetical protein J2A69_04305 [Burkholderia pseudomallei]QTB65719.1 hypothetical protein J3D99_02270 [Burkholderia pseudomallei]